MFYANFCNALSIYNRRCCWCWCGYCFIVSWKICKYASHYFVPGKSTKMNQQEPFPYMCIFSHLLVKVWARPAVTATSGCWVSMRDGTHKLFPCNFCCKSLKRFNSKSNNSNWEKANFGVGQTLQRTHDPLISAMAFAAAAAGFLSAWRFFGHFIFGPPAARGQYAKPHTAPLPKPSSLNWRFAHCTRCQNKFWSWFYYCCWQSLHFLPI